MGLTPVRRAGADGAPAGRRVLRGGGDAARSDRRRNASRTSSRARCCATCTTHGLDARDPGQRRGRWPSSCGSSTRGRSAASRPRRSTRDRAAPTSRPPTSIAEARDAAGERRRRDRGDRAGRSSSASPKQAEQLRAGKTSLMGFFVGQVMKETKGAANPQLVNDVLKKRLGLGVSRGLASRACQAASGRARAPHRRRQRRARRDAPRRADERRALGREGRVEHDRGRHRVARRRGAGHRAGAAGSTSRSST